MKKLLILGGIMVAVFGMITCDGDNGNGDNGNGNGTSDKGAIEVNSNPEGASIILDGEPTGETTNVIIPDVDTGSHDVELVLTGYNDTTMQVTVTGGDTVALSVTLETEIYGNLFVVSNPAGAEIWLDDSATGKVTNYLFSDLAAGQYAVKLVLDGYQDCEDTVKVLADTTITLDVGDLEKVKGYIAVSSTPTGAAISLDGTPTGQETVALIQNVDVGEHTVGLSKSGYVDTSVAVTVVEDETANVDVILTEQLEVHEIIQDESTPITGIGFQLPAGGRMAVMITPPGYPFQLTEACYVPFGWGNWDAECDLVFFNGNSSSGPSTEIARKSVSATMELDFNWFDVSDLDVIIESGSIFFAVENKYDDKPVMALDGKSPEHHVSWMYNIFQGETDFKWTPFDNINADWGVNVGDSADLVLRVKGVVPSLGHVAVTPTKIVPGTYSGWPRVQLPADMIAENP
ncbi:PEGA domain-containing protein [candidate division WOR-3 bacterium]|uniref:PEGA domain-containing protein n=1 Tax=candidate division WOR-3 bacterium TaxID=2052148 RepID=A0A9D5QCY3_UNCW3|nr:PEGA domain-containing protein [candidate division WOR-3 bacterium]MBD3365054.1 PEGA domain-containing protein [candidate division WOR-3 bacterium]